MLYCTKARYHSSLPPCYHSRPSWSCDLSQTSMAMNPAPMHAAPIAACTCTATINRQCHLCDSASPDALQVVCPSCHQRDLRRAGLETHLSACGAVLVRCRVIWQQQQCPALVPRGELVAHEMVCPLRAVVCEGGCRARLCVQQASSHRCVPHLAAELAGTQASLDTARDQLAAALADLAATRTQLSDTRAELGGQLGATLAELDDTRAELTVTRAELGQARAMIGDMLTLTRLAKLEADSADHRQVSLAVCHSVRLFLIPCFCFLFLTHSLICPSPDHLIRAIAEAC